MLVVTVCDFSLFVFVYKTIKRSFGHRKRISLRVSPVSNYNFLRALEINVNYLSMIYSLCCLNFVNFTQKLKGTCFFLKEVSFCIHIIRHLTNCCSLCFWLASIEIRGYVFACETLSLSL